MGRLDGKTALVTGAARGTGAEIAKRFVAEGATVVLADILDDRGTALADELGQRFVHLDVTDEAAWRETVASLDVLHVLVNNAAILHLTSIDNTDVELFEKVLRVNAVGTFLGIKACLPLLREAGGASIVNIGSIDSVMGVPATVAYTASKFAMRGITKVTALENGKHAVRCNIVCPAAGNPEMYLNLEGPQLDLSTAGGGERRARIPSIPLGRSQGPSDVVGAALFFASDDSRFCTGTELVLDGGMGAGEYVSVPGQFSID